MKIQKLRFRNLNSLVGEWSIDFMDPSFTTDGIFAITGPTGAGKTTILDAICLALYGATPRLPRISKSTNEIMSRGAGECLAEVTYETPSGRYRCTWSQHRAQKKAIGELQNPKHELALAESGTLVATSLRTVADEVEKTTGLNLDRFTRSVLLAQGDFARFLQSNASERAPILEQITQTEIYSRISMEVHQRERQERCCLEELSAKLGNLELLSAEQIESLQAELLALEIEIQNQNQLVEEARRRVDWKRGLTKLEEELLELERGRLALQQEFEAFKPQQARLQRAVTAAELDGPFASLQSLRESQATQQKTLGDLEAELPKAIKACEEAEGRLKLAMLTREQAQAACRDFEPRKTQIEALDREIRSAQENLCLHLRELTELDQAIADESARLEKLNAKENEITATIEEGEQYFRINAADECLVDGLSGLQVQLEQLATLDRELKKQEEESKVISAKLEMLERDLRKRQWDEEAAAKAVEEVSASQKQAQADLDRLLAGRKLSELREEQSELQSKREHARILASLEEHRARLHSGEPCPLCGALEHPFAAQVTAPVSELESRIRALGEVISQAEDLVGKMRENQTKANEAESKRVEAQARTRDHVRSIEIEQRSLSAVEKVVAGYREECTELTGKVLLRLQPLGIDTLPADELQRLAKDLESRQQTWKEKKRESASLVLQLAPLRQEQVRGQTRREGLQARRLDLAEKREQTQGALDRKIQTRKEALGELDPAKEAERLAGMLSDAQAAEKREEKRLHDDRRDFDSISQRVNDAENAIRTRSLKISLDEAKFSEMLAERGFADEADFLASLMQPEERKECAERERELDRKDTALKERLRDRTETLEHEKSKDLSKEPLPDLEQTLELRGRELAEKNKTKVIRTQVMLDNQQKIDQAGTLQERIARQQVECEKWRKLDELIGSSDGKKFRNFAQAITFQRLISHANQQLRKMSERYELVSDKESPLELCVRDNDQAGEVRPTKNLSGGESFIVSLALALGLSQMASGRVRVDSLFLDEGFGTLDEISLETALSALAELRQTGKLIGLISHVSALNERINTKIEVSKVGQGRSRIDGPGCSRIA